MSSQIPDPNDPGQAGASQGAQPDASGQPQAPQPPQAPPVGDQQYAPPGQQGQYIPPQDQPVGSSLQLNYWLSVFFIFIPALIFFLTEKGRSPKLDQFNRENLNFSLIRTAVWLISVVLGGIPILGWLIVIAAFIAQVVLFVFHILVAVKVKDNFDAGGDPGFIFNIPLVK